MDRNPRSLDRASHALRMMLSNSFSLFINRAKYTVHSSCAHKRLKDRDWCPLSILTPPVLPLLRFDPVALRPDWTTLGYFSSPVVSACSKEHHHHTNIPSLAPNKAQSPLALTGRSIVRTLSTIAFFLCFPARDSASSRRLRSTR